MGELPGFVAGIVSSGGLLSAGLDSSPVPVSTAIGRKKQIFV